jgi:aryl-alcohol dehydrogenase-like predicted oxidoreductase
MSRLALGTVQFGQSYGIANQKGQVSRASAREILQLASDRGIDLLDTAIAYGESEACLGEAGVNAFRVVTKLPAVPEGCSDVARWVREQFGASLQRLGVRAVYGLLLHRPVQLLEPVGAELYRALMALKDAGTVGKVGVSVYSPDELAALIPRYRIDLVQAPFNLIDQRLKASGWLMRLKQNDIEVHTRSAFLQGLLLMSQSAIPSKFSPWADIWSEWHQWLASQAVSAVQACLACPLSCPEIDRVVVGVDGVEHLAKIIDAANGAVDVMPPDLACNDENLINPSNWPKL